jgi:hypothetical protein
MMVAAGCSSSKITSSWKATTTALAAGKKIMVVGLIRESDRTIREQMEAHMIDDLKALGYLAVSAYQEYGPKAFDNMDEAAVIDKLKGSNVDAVMTIVLLNKEMERLYKPGVMARSPYAPGYNRFWGYYTTLQNRIYSPGYYETSTKYFWESNLYDVHTKDLLYSVQTQSYDPFSTPMLGHEYGKKIVANMVKKNVLLQTAVTH